jgi:hypothetical protein
MTKPKKLSIIVDDKCFVNSTHLEDYTRVLLERVGITKSVLCIDKAAHKFLIDLCSRHPNKSKTCGLQDFRISKNPRNSRAYHLDILKEDGSEIHVSWKTCASGKPTSIKTNLTAAMRSSIEPQIKHFRLVTISNNCESCQKHVFPEVSHIHHEGVEFCELQSEFIKEYGKETPKLFANHPSMHQAIFLKSDEDFEIKWIEYHQKHATLQYVCPDCNLSVKKRKKI